MNDPGAAVCFFGVCIFLMAILSFIFEELIPHFKEKKSARKLKEEQYKKYTIT